MPKKQADVFSILQTLMEGTGLHSALRASASRRFALQLRQESTCVIPKPLDDAGKSGEVDLNLYKAAAHLDTMLEDRGAMFGTLLEFLSVSTPQRDHRFIGRSLSRDREISVGRSSTYAKLVGIAALTQRGDVAWYAPMTEIWDHGLPLRGDVVRFTKRLPKEDGPDYLAATFPYKKDRPASKVDRLLALEFKGRAKALTFTSAAFAKWRQQATNIRGRTATRKFVNISSWTVGLNYVCAEAPRARERSALLVEDPRIATPDELPVISEDAPVDPVIRRHLARSCRAHGAGLLVPHVLHGLRPEGLTHPPVWRIGSRHYIGDWIAVGREGTVERCVPSVSARNLAPARGWFVPEAHHRIPKAVESATTVSARAAA